MIEFEFEEKAVQLTSDLVDEHIGLIVDTLNKLYEQYPNKEHWFTLSQTKRIWHRGINNQWKPGPSEWYSEGPRD